MQKLYTVTLLGLLFSFLAFALSLYVVSLVSKPRTNTIVRERLVPVTPLVSPTATPAATLKPVLRK